MSETRTSNPAGEPEISDEIVLYCGMENGKEVFYELIGICRPTLDGKELFPRLLVRRVDAELESDVVADRAELHQFPLSETA